MHLLFTALLGGAAASAMDVLLVANSNESLAQVANLHTTCDREVETKVDESLSGDAYAVRINGVSVPAKDAEEVAMLLGISEKLNETPADMFDICSSLKDVTADPNANLRTGAASFAIVFVDNAEDIKRLGGIEENVHVRHFISSDAELAKSLGTPFPGVFSYNAIERTVLPLPLYSAFAATNAATTVDAFTRIKPSNVKFIQELEQPLHYVIDKRENYRTLKDAYGVALRGFSAFSKFLFFYPEEVPALVKLANIQESDYPLIITLGADGKYIVRNINRKPIVDTLRNLLARENVERLAFTAEIPVDNETRPVKVVGSATVPQIIADTSMDRLIAVMSPNCHYCKMLQPELMRFASTLQDKKLNIFVGAFNVVENEEFAPAKVTGVPVLFFIKKDSEELIQLPANVRTFDTLAAFVAEHASSAAAFDLDAFKRRDAAEEPTVTDSSSDAATVSGEEVNDAKLDTTVHGTKADGSASARDVL
ncbi:hypothetical protein PAPHI01_1758 [Pancytospora philotis]|nr:hypothetical protein PAPHI01_1758 [Pancytospora philotis]